MSVRTAERAAASRRDASADRYRFRAHDLIPRNGRGIPRAAAGDHSSAVHDRDSRNVRGIPHAAAENPSGVTHEPVLEAARRSLHEAPGNQSHAAHDPNPRNDPDNPHAAVGSQSRSTGGQSPAAYRGSPHGATTRKVHLYHDPSWADRPWSLVGTTWAPERSPRRVPFGRHPLQSALTSPAPGRTAARPTQTPQLLHAQRWTHRGCSPRSVPKSRAAVRRRFCRSSRRLGVLCLRRLGHRSPGRCLPDPSHPIGAHHLKIRHVLPNPDDRPRLGGRLCVRCRPVCSRRHPALTVP